MRPRPGKTGKKAQLQAAGDLAGRIEGDSQQLIGIRLDRGEGRDITRVDGIGNDLPGGAEIVVGEKPDDGGEIGLASEPETMHTYPQ